MSGIDDKVQIGSSSDFLEGVSVDTTAGMGLFREGVVVSDPESAEARQRVTNTTPAANDFGAVVRIAGVDVLPIGQDISTTDIGLVTHSIIQGFSTGGGGEYHDVKVTPSGALTVEAEVVGTVSITGEVQIAEPVTVEGSVTITDANQSGAWNYLAGTDGSATVPANNKVLQISASASTALAASFSVNGGPSIPIPLGQAITLEPRGNLVSPTIVFTNTASYVVEYVG